MASLRRIKLVRRETSDIGTIKLVLTAWRLKILNIKMKPFRPNSKLVWDRAVDWGPLVPSVTQLPPHVCTGWWSLGPPAPCGKLCPW